MVQPSDVDRVPDEYAQHFEDRMRRARPVRIRLKDPLKDSFAGQSRYGALAVLGAQNLDSALVVARRPT